MFRTKEEAVSQLPVRPKDREIVPSEPGEKPLTDKVALEKVAPAKVVIEDMVDQKIQLLLKKVSSIQS